jgi:hypothetical protein
MRVTRKRDSDIRSLWNWYRARKRCELCSNIQIQGRIVWWFESSANRGSEAYGSMRGDEILLLLLLPLLPFPSIMKESKCINIHFNIGAFSRDCLIRRTENSLRRLFGNTFRCSNFLRILVIHFGICTFIIKAG